MGFFRQEYWNQLLFPSPGDLPYPGIKPRSPTLAGGFSTSEPLGEPCLIHVLKFKFNYFTFLEILYLFQIDCAHHSLCRLRPNPKERLHMSLSGKAYFLTPLPVAKGIGKIAEDLSIPVGGPSRLLSVFSASSLTSPALQRGPTPVSIRSLAVHVLG